LAIGLGKYWEAEGREFELDIVEQSLAHDTILEFLGMRENREKINRK